jgi:hypothetical protein
MARTGRPRKEIDWPTVDKLAELYCTETDIAAFLAPTFPDGKLTVDTLCAAAKRDHKCTFSEYIQKGTSRGDISLRRSMRKAVDAGSVPMMIWLSKQRLGYTDKQELSGNPDKPQRIIVEYADKQPDPE